MAGWLKNNWFSLFVVITMILGWVLTNSTQQAIRSNELTHIKSQLTHISSELQTLVTRSQELETRLVRVETLLETLLKELQDREVIRS